MTNTSRYIQINDWALLEYEYISESIQINNAKPFRIENEYTNEYSFVNNNISKNLTNNVIDNNSIQVSTVGNRWAYLDTDTIIPTLNSDPKLTLIDESTNFNTGDIAYDTIKIHIVSGFNLDGLDGLIASIKIKDKTGKAVCLSNFTFLSNDSSFSFNSNPLFLGERLYDKYIEFKIPALSSILSVFQANTSNTGSFGYIFSSENLGFDNDGLINFTLHEIDNTEIQNGNRFFITGEKYETSFLPADIYGLLGAKIRESNNGDYYEYFATFDGGFPENYIANLNSTGGQWVIIHQIEVYEQIGAETIRTHNMTVLQENEFDKPNLFRPIVVNSDIAFSFSVDYTMRFLNKADGQQIIRKSSVTSLEPKKYGREIERIQVSNGYRPIRVYNKIINSDDSGSVSSSFLQNSPGVFKTIQSVKYVPVFYSNTNISISSKGKTSQNLEQTIWSQGKAIILINEFDNRIKFKIYDKTIDDELQSLDLSTNAKIQLSFILDDRSKVYIDSEISTASDPSSGEVEFVIKGDISSKLLTQQNKTFYLISVAGNQESETVLYQGKYENFKNMDNVVDLINQEIESSLDKKIKTLQDLQDARNRTGNNNSNQESIQANPQREILIAEETKSKNKQSKFKELLSITKTKTQEQLKDAANNKNFKFREIPGKNIQLSSSFKSIKPKVKNPSNPFKNKNK